MQILVATAVCSTKRRGIAWTRTEQLLLSSTFHTAMRHGHFVQFFHSDGQQIDAMAWFVRETLEADGTAVVLATPEHRAAVGARLESFGLDVSGEIAAYRYIEVDASTALSQFFDGTRCDHEKFHHQFDTLLRQVAARGKPVRVYGEIVNLLAQRNLDAAVLEVEELWNELSRHHAFTLFCGYSRDLLPDTAQMRKTLERVCALHSLPPPI